MEMKQAFDESILNNPSSAKTISLSSFWCKQSESINQTKAVII